MDDAIERPITNNDEQSAPDSGPDPRLVAAVENLHSRTCTLEELAARQSALMREVLTVMNKLLEAAKAAGPPAGLLENLTGVLDVLQERERTRKTPIILHEGGPQ